MLVVKEDFILNEQKIKRGTRVRVLFKGNGALGVSIEGFSNGHNYISEKHEIVGHSFGDGSEWYFLEQELILFEDYSIYSGGGLGIIEFVAKETFKLFEEKIFKGTPVRIIDRDGKLLRVSIDGYKSGCSKSHVSSFGNGSELWLIEDTVAKYFEVDERKEDWE